MSATLKADLYVAAAALVIVVAVVFTILNWH